MDTCILFGDRSSSAVPREIKLFEIVFFVFKVSLALMDAFGEIELFFILWPITPSFSGEFLTDRWIGENSMRSLREPLRPMLLIFDLFDLVDFIALLSC